MSDKIIIDKKLFEEHIEVCEGLTKVIDSLVEIGSINVGSATWWGNKHLKDSTYYIKNG